MVGTVGPDLGAPCTVLLVRHARTDATGRLLSGGVGAGPPLNEQGRTEAAATARRLATGQRLPARPEVLISSPSARARQTAAASAAELDLPVHEDPSWVEADPGAWNLLATDEIRAHWPEHYQQWLADPQCAPPQGESCLAAFARAGAAVRALTDRYPGRCVAVFTHATPIIGVLSAALQVPAGLRGVWGLEPGSVSAVQYWRDGGVQVCGVNTH